MQSANERKPQQATAQQRRNHDHPTMASARKETERTKFIQDKCQSLLTQMLRDEDNKYCVDCDAKGMHNV